jgi:hypothetical protein
MDQTIERWRPIAGLEDRYEVSDHGRVRSLPRMTARGGIPQRVRGKVIAQRTNGWGLQVTLIANERRVHSAVVPVTTAMSAAAFQRIRHVGAERSQPPSSLPT